jgi:hypothetical protein
VNPAIRARKLADLRGRVARVRTLLPADVAGFLAQRTETEALVLNLFLALQCSSDLALHEVAERGLGVPADARSAFEALARAGVIPLELARCAQARRSGRAPQPHRARVREPGPPPRLRGRARRPRRPPRLRRRARRVNDGASEPFARVAALAG